MINWSEYRDSVIAEILEAPSMTAALEAVSEIVGEAITQNALSKAWRRWEDNQLVSGPLSDNLGTGAGYVLPPEPRGTAPLKYDSYTRPPAPSPDNHVRIDVPESGYMIVEGDNHYPIQDPYMEAAKVALIRDIKPAVGVDVGDKYDFWMVSDHAKEAGRIFDPGARLQEEFDSSKPYDKECSRIIKKRHYIKGNHENRLERHIGLNPGYFGLRALELGRLAELPENVTVYSWGTRLAAGATTLEHGDRIGQGKRTPADATGYLLKNKINRNTIFGHTHHAAMKYFTGWDANGEPHTYFALNQGHGSDVSKQTYVQDPNWQHGFTIVEYFTVGGKSRFTPHFIPVINGAFSFAGKLYDGHKLI